MNRHSLKQPVGWTLIAIGVLVMLGTLQRHLGISPLTPRLVPLFGTAFVIVFLAVQVGLCFWFRTTIGLAWIAGAFAVGLVAGSIYESIWSEPTALASNPAMEEVLREHGIATPGYDWTRHKLVTGVCISAVAAGLGLATDKL